eukprot:3641952-Rhodomonas_salina.1
MKSAKGEYEFGQMPLKTYLCKGSPDIYFKPGRQPSITGREHPDIVFAEIPSYCGDEIIPGHPHLVPLGSSCWEECCLHDCKRQQVPLRPCWAISITCHKAQSMTIGPDKPVQFVEIDFGSDDTGHWAPGAAVVQLSSTTEVGSVSIDGKINSHSPPPVWYKTLPTGGGLISEHHGGSETVRHPAREEAGPSTGSY